MRGGPETEHLSHLFEIGLRPLSLPAVEGQSSLGQTLTQHALPPSGVDQRGVGRQSHHIRLNQHLVAQDEDRHDRERDPVLTVEVIRDMFVHKQFDELRESLR